MINIFKRKKEKTSVKEKRFVVFFRILRAERKRRITFTSKIADLERRLANLEVANANLIKFVTDF